MKRAVLFAACLAAGALQLQAVSADTPPLRVHGVVKEFDGQYLTVKSDSGKTIVLGLQLETRIVHSRVMTLADIKAGDFVGTLALKTADGKLRAQGVRVFSTATLGAGEGQYPADSNPSRIVTNATVSAVTTGPAGGVLSLTFHGAGPAGDPACTGRASAGGWGCVGSAELSIARGVPIIALTSGDTSLLLQGAIVSAYATADATNLLTANSITVERDGKPAPALAQ